MLKRIAITGPESTGKTWLAHELASRYGTNMVHEHAREYFHGREYVYNSEDLIAIAKGQLENEESIATISRNIIFCDTDIVAVKIWAKVVFGDVPEWIEKQIRGHVYDLYILCYPDLKWQPDPLRNNPHDRQYIYGLFVDELERNNFNYRVVKGIGGQRLKNAIGFVDELMENGFLEFNQ